ncbi:MAG: tRNA lysidine(34) synthetase TilS, partial [Wenzhouxiangellaceae bacterium]|nr:tRNA lysidine(34) synthetase TilS [Wenzhouxiangellaceae bacterium]
MNAGPDRPAGFDPALLHPGDGNWVAFSGGPDSLCLLDLAVAEVGAARVRAVHVDHRADSDSARRARRAVELAARLGAECLVLKLDGNQAESGLSPEHALRTARYAAIAGQLRDGDRLLVAHHADDQLETRLQMLLRGSGARGVAGMRPERPLPPGTLARPLLACTRTDLQRWLDQRGLAPVEDPTNDALDADRNWLRHRVLPRVLERWPGARSAALLGAARMHAAVDALVERAAADVADLALERHGETVLDRESLQGLEPFRAVEALRTWLIDTIGRAPPETRLEHFLEQSRSAGEDRQPELDWDGGVLHAHGDAVWLDAAPPPDPDWTVDWKHGDRIALPHGLGHMEWSGGDRPGTRWQVGAPRRGDRLDVGGVGRRRMADLLREAGVPPWRRRGWPVLRIDDTPVALGARWLDRAFREHLGASGCRLSWRPGPA